MKTWKVVSSDRDIRIASATPAGLSATSELSSSETVSEIVVDSPGRVVGASISRTATLTTVDSVGVSDGIIFVVTSQSGSIDFSLAAPRARRLAAVPVSCRVTTSRSSTHGERTDQGEESKRTHDGKGLVCLKSE
jgi:hypothetical protein